eukprot:TRINITY_DN3368_c0_g1_i1.p1 TRINITY_DN3368_c0_g1~~TRINITY_DN3368_c0_g1_i1.p1  ORF type:complete len:455 (+),score=49.21 TRINITY_DN3368_c0_g1_i1:66-1430(+)
MSDPSVFTAQGLFGLYQFDPAWKLPAEASGIVTFEAKTSEILVALCVGENASGKLYELVATDEYAALRCESQGEPEVFVEGDFVSPDEHRPFWLRVSNGKVEFGRGSPANPAGQTLVYEDKESPLPVTHVAFTTWRSPADYRAISVGQKAALTVNTSTKGSTRPAASPNTLPLSPRPHSRSFVDPRFQAEPPIRKQKLEVGPVYGLYTWESDWVFSKVGVGAITFEVKATESFMIGFSREAQTAPPLYELHVNTQRAVIRRDAQGQDLHTVTGDFIQPNKSVPYWVKVDNGLVEFGTGRLEENCVLRWKDSAPVKVRYFCLTGWNAPVQYKNIRSFTFESVQAATSAGDTALAQAGAASGGARVVHAQSSRAYLEEEILPTLLPAVEALLRVTEKRNKDISEGHGVNQTFHPIHWLASYLMRNNPRIVQTTNEKFIHNIPRKNLDEAGRVKPGK